MSTQPYAVTPRPTETLITLVKSGEIAIPEIQRPFVWECSRILAACGLLSITRFDFYGWLDNRRFHIDLVPVGGSS